MEEYFHVLLSEPNEQNIKEQQLKWFPNQKSHISLEFSHSGSYLYFLWRLSGGCHSNSFLYMKIWYLEFYYLYLFFKIYSSLNTSF